MTLMPISHFLNLISTTNEKEKFFFTFRRDRETEMENLEEQNKNPFSPIASCHCVVKEKF